MIKAKKEFGQNFLQDHLILRKIIEAMPSDVSNIVEIGPGLGDLTKEILKKQSVFAIEIDADLFGLLKKRFANELQSKQLELINADVLAYWEERGSLASSSYYLVANLPYYIATKIILRALRDPNCVGLIVTIQKEVADKFLAQPKMKEFSALALIAQSVGEVEELCLVSPTAFNPAPKVESRVIKIVKKAPSYDERFAAFLKRAFLQPRKMLQKNLSAFYPSDLIAKYCGDVQIDPKSRSHEVELVRFFDLFLLLEGVGNGKQRE